MSILVRDTPEAAWRTILEVGQADALTTHPLAFAKDGRRLLALSSSGADTSRLVWLDCADGSQTVVAEDPAYDVAGALLDPDTNDPQVAVVQRERLGYTVLDPAVAGDVERLRELEDGDLEFAGRDNADRIWLVGYSRDDGPIRYHAFDRRSGEATFLFEHQPALSGYELARMEPFSFTARDGLEIHGYLTFPPGAGAPVTAGRGQRPRRTVGAGHLGLRPRGAVAGEPGLPLHSGQLPGLDRATASAFVNAGDREWGRKMHDDLIDAVELGRREGLRRPRADRHLRGLVRRLRGARRCGVHPGRVPLRGRHGRAVEPEDADRVDPALLGSADRPVPYPGRRTQTTEAELPLGALPALAGGRHPASRC